MTFLVDSHCHLTSLSLEGKAGNDIHKIITRANRVGVSHFLSIACTTKEFEANKKLADEYDNIYLACGIHPLNLEDEPNWSDEALKDILLSSNKVIALGETGLDFHYAPETKDIQIPSFARQIAIAKDVKKPLVIHAREAKNETLALLKSENARDVGGVIHCFTDTVDMARQCLDLGFYISFTGIATFKPSNNVREVVKYVPLDRMMVETDCPYLAPIPVRGVENEPAFVRYTLKYIADFKGTTEQRLADITSKNFENLYGLKLEQPQYRNEEISNYKIEKILDKDFEN